MWSRVELKEDSKVLLRLNYWPFVLVAFIHTLVAGAGEVSSRVSGSRYQDIGSGYAFNGVYDSGHHNYGGFSAGGFVWGLLGLVFAAMLGIAVVSILLMVFVLNPLEVGCKRYMTMAREVKPRFGEMVFAFRSCYGNIVKTMFLKNLYIFLWSLLLVIPGIVKSYEYRMVPYLMAEYPDMAASEAFRISKEMMYGNKWETVVLDLSFIGWRLLSGITYGIVGIFYVWPYEMLTNAALYLTLKKTNPAFGYVKPDDNYYYRNNM